MNKNWLILFFLVIFHGSIWAGDFVSPDSLPRHGFFCYAPYGRSLYADLHPNSIRLDFAYHTNHPSYDWAATGRNYRWSVEGVFVGARYNTPHYDGYFSNFAWGLLAYYGNCPHGQFRNLNNYSQIGISLIFE